MTRGIVIFADYLSDLVVLDTVSEIIQTPNIELALLHCLLGVVTGIYVADVVTGLANWASMHYIPHQFRVFPHEVSTGDIFDALVNGCFVMTPSLTLLSCWVETSHSANDILPEAFLVTSLSLCALSPLLGRPGFCEGLNVLRDWGVLRGGEGYCRVFGGGEWLVRRIVRILEVGFKVAGVRKQDVPERRVER